METNLTKALITGGSGFIGSHLTEKLVKNKWSVSVFDIADFRDKDLLSKISYFKTDVRDWPAVKEAVEEIKPDYIFHLAAIPSLQLSLKDPLDTLQTNALGTINILEAARVFNAKKVVLVSSASVYGAKPKNPQELISEDRHLNILNPYALSKKWLEDAAKLWSLKEIWEGIKTVSLRYFNVYGPRQPRDAAYATCIEKFLHQWRNKKPLTVVPDGNQRRDFIHVFDVVAATIKAALSQNVGRGEVLNIGSGKNYSILELAEIVGGKDYPTVFIEPRLGEAKYVLADISKAKKLLDWEPKISLKEGLNQLKQL